MTINYYAKNVYGNTTYYFADDNDQTQAIQGLTGQRTITSHTAKCLKLLGIELNLVGDPSDKGL